ncbi:MAG: hypothetical protein JNL09_02920 [Anaerolineales bacterium]|nr:hypothetical protein [Anaerolineales bacterium]
MKTENLNLNTPRGLPLNLQQLFLFSTLRLDAAEQKPAVWAAMLGGAGLGLVWGIAARVWMRLISTEPEFSIFGTAAILIVFTLFGLFAGLGFAARRRGWRGVGHYLPRALAVMFFIPMGAFGGTPLMLTVLLATLGLTQRAVVSVWFLAALALLVVSGTDFGLPMPAAITALVVALAVTAWNWLAPRWRDNPKLQLVNVWLDRILRTVLLLLAVAGFWSVARDVLSSHPMLLGLLYVFLYFILLYPLVLALRIGLKPYEGRQS